MIQINMGIQGDGTTFRLAPGTKEQIQREFPNAEPAGSVYVSYDTDQNAQQHHGSMWKQLILLLTSLTREQIELLGGARFVSFPDQTERARYPQCLEPVAG